ncbi:MAG: AraC family transcriptional regulator [Kiritimatiellia bacterium]|nr:AraC family transcriptional regulator [Kiritimatiellia bacterium]
MRLANQRFERARALAGPLNLAGVSLTLRHIHFGPGIYREGPGAGMHEHGQVHVEYIVSGQFRFRAEGQEETLLPGQGVVVLPGAPHGWECCVGGYMVGVLLDLVGRRKEEFLRFMADSTPEPLAAFESADAAAMFSRLLPLLGAESEVPWLRERVGFLAGLWLSEVLAGAWPLGSWQLRDTGTGREDDVCRRAQEFMTANCTHPVQLADVALEVGVSVRHLNRLYRRSYGESPGEALGRLRLEAARRLLLAEKDIPLKAVAYRCGYSNHAYLTACYRARYDETPTQTRRSRAFPS